MPVVESELVMKHLNMTSNSKITPELRTFAVTLHFYSPPAYNYVRDSFNKILPHPSTIPKWYTTVDGTAGFTDECLKAIEIKVKEMNEKNKK